LYKIIVTTCLGLRSAVTPHAFVNPLSFLLKLPDPIPDQSGDHYREYKEMYGKVETTGGHCPSLTDKPKSAMPTLSSAQNVTTQKQLCSTMNVKNSL